MGDIVLSPYCLDKEPIKNGWCGDTFTITLNMKNQLNIFGEEKMKDYFGKHGDLDFMTKNEIIVRIIAMCQNIIIVTVGNGKYIQKEIDRLTPSAVSPSSQTVSPSNKE